MKVLLPSVGVQTRAPASTKSDHWQDKELEKVIKSLLFLLPNGLVDPLGLVLLEL